MPASLSCYYLDEPLNDEELQFVERTLLGAWATFPTGATTLIQKRVPAVLPTPNANGEYANSREYRAAQVRGNLRHASILKDAGKQVVWLMPRDNEWDAIFQFAIREETGWGPFAVQRWFIENAQSIRRSVRIVDTQKLIQEL